MSSYRNETALRQAEAGATVCALAGVDVDDAAGIAKAAQALAEAESALGSAEVVEGLPPGTLDALKVLAPQTWPALSQALLGAADAPALAGAAADAFAEAEGSLGMAARTALVDTVLAFVAEPEQAFAHVEVATGDHVTAIHAVRSTGGETVVFQVDDKGGLQHEYAGHVGTSCEIRAAEFETFARARGIALDTTVHEPHVAGGPDGARLILDAVRRDPVHPARGALLNAEGSAQVRARSRRPGIFEPTATPATPRGCTTAGGAA